MGFPNNDGNVVMNTQATTTLGNLTTLSTVNPGAGATTTGVTKDVSLGTLGVSGSITNLQIGSSVAGALGTTTINSPTVSFGAKVTAINLPDVATFLVANADPTKTVKFALEAILTGTTRTLTAQGAGGTLALVTRGEHPIGVQ